MGLGASQKAERPARAWQRMLSGRRLDLLDPSPLDIEIEDIAHGLARVARWNGQTVGEHAFSVAQHSLLVARIGEKLFAKSKPHWYMALLLHDAPEYVVGDMISPFKAVIGGDYKSLENRLQQAIHLRFSLPPELSKAELRAIKSCDRMAAFFEATRLAGFSDAEAARFFSRPRGVTGQDVSDLLKPLPAHQAQGAFLDAFGHLASRLAMEP
uniref:HD family hydrolase n=1 Tax=Pararhizobium sp. IMCC3301 TaxID=3067904 RepID=UPI0027413B3E|nr:HD family hydrolase [Pararhizobium sp. IMCC3301]